MAVDVIDLAVPLERLVQQILQRAVVRHMKALDAPTYGLGREPARIDRPAVLQRAPDERLADARLAAGPVFPGPRTLDQLEVDIAGVAVGIQVGARKGRGEERRPEFVRRGIELVHVAVLRLAQLGLADDGVEVGGEVVPRMGRIENQGHRRRHRRRITEWKPSRLTMPGGQRSTRRSITSPSANPTSRACAPTCRPCSTASACSSWPAAPAAGPR